MNSLRTSLEALVDEHRKLGSPVGDYLRPGIPATAVVAQLEGLGLTAPPDVIDFYGWADGTDEAAWQAAAGPAPFLRFVGNAYFPSLDGAVQWCGTIREIAKDIAYDSDGVLAPDELWNPTWFPVLRRDRGEFAVACSPDAATVHGVVWEMPGEGQTYPNLIEFIRSAAIELREHFVWLPDDKVLLRREVAELRRSVGGSRPDPGGL